MGRLIPALLITWHYFTINMLDFIMNNAWLRRASHRWELSLGYATELPWSWSSPVVLKLYVNIFPKRIWIKRSQAIFILILFLRNISSCNHSTNIPHGIKLRQSDPSIWCRSFIEKPSLDLKCWSQFCRGLTNANIMVFDKELEFP